MAKETVMKTLVTGGGGFLGGAIVRQLVARGDKVRSFSRNSYSELSRLGIEHQTGDLSDEKAVDRAVAGCDVVYHVGAKAGVWGPHEEYYRANVVGTQNVLHACQKHHVGRLVYTSSPSVVFNGGDMAGVNETVPYAEHFDAPYPETKTAAEKMVLSANSRELSTVALRPHLIFGPGDPHLMPRIVAKARSGRLRIIGNGENKVDIVYVDNAADAHILAGDKLEPGAPIAGKAYFITNDEPRTVTNVFDLIMRLHDLPPVRRRVPTGLAYFGGWLFEKTYRLLGIRQEPLVTRFVARELSTAHWFDISAARNDLGYRPKVSINEGFERIKARMQASG